MIDDQNGWIPEILKASHGGEAMLQALFQSHPDMLFVSDSRELIVAANSNGLKAMGYRRSQLEGQPIHMLVPEAVRDRHPSRTREFAKHPSIRPMGSGIDLFILDAGGDEHPVDIVLWPFTAVGENYVLAVCRRLDAELEHRQRQIQALVKNARGYAVILLDAEGQIRTWNEGAEQMYGLSASEALGKGHAILFTLAERLAGEPQRELELARQSSEGISWEGWRRNASGKEIWTEINCTAMLDNKGRTIGFTRVLYDMTSQRVIELGLRDANEALIALAADSENRVSVRTSELEETVVELRQKKAETEAYVETVAHDLQEKEILLREVYHRVKNNLQVVQSLLKMHARAITEPAAQEAIDAAVQRIQVMATVHERLYQMPNLASLSVPAYLKDVVEGAVNSSSVRSSSLDLQFSSDEIQINLDFAIPMGLLVNELVSNCLKHGLEAGKRGLIKVALVRADGAVKLTVEDNGRGFPADFDLEKTKSMGLKLATSLAQRLGGQLKFTSENGCKVESKLTRL